MPARSSVATFDLGLPGFDPPAALEAWLKLKSATQGFLIEKSGLDDRAFLGAAPFEALRVRRGRAWSQTRDKSRALSGNPFAALGRRLACFSAPGAAPFSTGAVGALSYEMARHLEKLPASPEAEEASLMLFDEILAWDRRRGRCELSVLLPARGAPRARAEAAGRAERLSAALRALPKRAPRDPERRGLAAMRGTLGRGRFMKGVRSLKDSIGRGDP